MKKLAVFLITFTVANLVVNEIRAQRAQRTNMKCVIRVIDENPKVLFAYPLEVAQGLIDVPYWWD